MDPSAEKDTVARNIGRYVLFREVAHGGMATVHLGRLRGVGGFARTVAIKRLHPQFARDPEFVSMFFDEARLAARIQHPNVVSVLDVVASERELFLVMDYVHGEGLSKLLKRARSNGIPAPANIVCAILIDLLYGLHAAHEALSERGDPLNIVHRDVSPQNVLVGVDGVARVLDFGIAKAALRANQSTRTGQLKGKLGYMAPEQIATGTVDRRADVYSAAVVLWEALTGERLFPTLETGALIAQILTRDHRPPSQWCPDLSAGLDAIVLRGLARKPEDRYASAHDMAADLEQAVQPATPRAIGEWVMRIAGQALHVRAASISEIEVATLGDFDPERNTTMAAFGEATPARAKAARVGDRPPERSAEPEAGEASAIGHFRKVGEVSDVSDWERKALESVHLSSPWRAGRRWWLAGGTAAILGALLAVRLLHVGGKLGASPSPAFATAESSMAAGVASKRTNDAVTSSGASSGVPFASPPPGSPPPPEVTTASPPADAAQGAAWSATQIVPLPAGKVWRAPAPRNDCTPPYVIDRSGVRIPKRWCS
jgi:serine/threonine-protein kinase